MARAVVQVSLVHDQSPGSVADQIIREGDHQMGPAELANLITGLGVRGGRIRVRIDESDSVDAGDRATGTIAITHANIASAAVTIGGVTLTEGTDFDAGADAGEDADAFAEAINGHASLGKIVIAESDSTDTVTLTYWAYGRDGETISMATADTDAFTLSGAALALGSNTDIAEVAVVEYRMGL